MKKTFPFIIIALLLVVISVMAFVLVKQLQEPKVEHNGIVYEPNVSTGIPVQAGTDLPGIAIPGWTTIKLPSNATEAEVSLHNPTDNDGYYDLSFTLKLRDSGEIIFSTGHIEPGYKCSKVTLSRKLEKGEFPAVLVVQPYLRDESKKPTNNAELDILLIVE